VVIKSHNIERIDEKGGMVVEKLVALHRNHFGEIISFVTSEGRIISYRKALMEVDYGLIQGAQTNEDRKGHRYLLPEQDQSFDHYPNLF
jgi:hypothetical protein